MKAQSSGESGQATVEYVILLSVVVTFFLLVSTGMKKMNLGEKLIAPIKGPFAAAYRYGHPKAKGYEDGGPTYHPRVVGGDQNFRIFFNPK